MWLKVTPSLLPSEPPTSLLQVVGGLPTSTSDGLGPMPQAGVILLRVLRSLRLSHRSGLAEDGKAELVLHNN